MRHKLIENGWSSSKISVLPHFQNLPAAPTPYPGQGASILYFGRLSPEKGVSDLLNAMASLPHIRLIVAGDGSQRGELQALAQRLGLQNVRFAGHVTGDALDRLIADSQFTVFPSRAYETMGKSILESYAQGRAVVASDLGSRRELVDEGETGVLYRVCDAVQLASAISFLYDRPELAQRMGERGRELVQERHSQAEHCRALTHIYEKLAKSARPERWVKRSSRSPVRVALIGGRGIVGKYSGVESYYEETGRRLAAKGHEITAYCRNYFTPDVREHCGIRVLRLPTIRSKHLDTLVHTAASTIHACFSPYDIVHYHTLGPSLFSYLPRLFGKKTIVTVQGLDHQRKKWSWLAQHCLRLGEWTSAHMPDRTVVVSRTLEGNYRARHAKPTIYIPNGTIIRERRSGPWLRQFGFAPNQYALFLGRFSPEKNCHLLVEAFEKIETNMKLVLAGGSSHTDDYAAELRRHGSKRIKFLDWLSGDAFEEVLTNAAVFVLPSDMEGLSLALLEAMGAGVCVLASDVPENREVVDGAGFTFCRGDMDDLQRMLTLLLSDARLRSAAGERARARVVERYLWDDVTNQIEAVYLGLAAPKVGLAAAEALALHADGD